jgi:threonine dehydrogenase-like Zn-dependent dehydrogenase
LNCVQTGQSFGESFGSSTRFDIVVDCTGVPQVMNQALDVLRDTEWDLGWTDPPAYVVQGSYSGNAIFEYDKAFRKQAVVLFPRDNTSLDRRAILDLVAEGGLRLDDLLTHTPLPSEAKHSYLKAADPGSSVLGMAFDWSAG